MLWRWWKVQPQCSRFSRRWIRLYIYILKACCSLNTLIVTIAALNVHFKLWEIPGVFGCIRYLHRETISGAITWANYIPLRHHGNWIKSVDAIHRRADPIHLAPTYCQTMTSLYSSHHVHHRHPFYPSFLRAGPLFLHASSGRALSFTRDTSALSGCDDWEVRWLRRGWLESWGWVGGGVCTQGLVNGYTMCRGTRSSTLQQTALSSQRERQSGRER